MLSVYVTGTDTGISKTVASVALLQAMRARVRSAVGMKPVASGCERVGNEWRNADALALQGASQPVPPYSLVNPVALSEPAAPEPATPAAVADHIAEIIASGTHNQAKALVASVTMTGSSRSSASPNSAITTTGPHPSTSGYDPELTGSHND